MTTHTTQPDKHPTTAKGIALITGVWKAAWALLLCAASAGLTLACVRLTAATDGKADHVHSSPSQMEEGNASPWARQMSSAATQADAWFDNYQFRDGGTLPRLRLHYATLGTLTTMLEATSTMPSW